MASINSELETISAGVYGSIVRVAIHDAIEKINRLGTLNGNSDTTSSSDLSDGTSEFSSSGGTYATAAQINKLVSDLEDFEKVVNNSWTLLNGYKSQIDTNEANINELVGRIGRLQGRIEALAEAMDKSAKEDTI